MTIWAIIFSLFAVVSVFGIVGMARYLIALTNTRSEPDPDEPTAAEMSAQEIKDMIRYEEELRILHSFSPKKKKKDD